MPSYESRGTWKAPAQDIKMVEKRDRFHSSSTAKDAFKEASAKQVRIPLEPLHLQFKDYLKLLQRLVLPLH